jgi:hypothetical protein
MQARRFGVDPRKVASAIDFIVRSNVFHEFSGLYVKFSHGEAENATETDIKTSKHMVFTETGTERSISFGVYFLSPPESLQSFPLSSCESIESTVLVHATLAQNVTRIHPCLFHS